MSTQRLFIDFYDSNLSFFIRAEAFFQDITMTFINSRVLPYLKDNKLQPVRDYTLHELHEQLEIPENRLRSYISTPGRLPSTSVSYGKRTRKVVKGIDIALHQLKGERKKHYTAQEVAVLFNISASQVEKLRLPPLRNGGYATQQFVYPIYDNIAIAARKRFIKE
ncbi:MAG: hypothetical protein AABW65_02535 [Nanoarchaeota archaeon]